MIPAIGEKFRIQVIKRKENSPYEYESKVSVVFKCRPASSKEISSYRLQQGVNVSNDSVYVYCSNLPVDVKIGDKVIFQNEIKTIESIGVYFGDDCLVNECLFNDDYISKRCPKGLTLK